MARKSAAEVKEEAENPLHPKWSEKLVAHSDAERQLLELIHAGRLPHALLLTGPRGIGKATLAWRLARFLLTPRETDGGLFGAPPPPDTLDVSAQHPSFRRLVAGGHPDFLILEADTIKVEESRQIPAFLSLTPAESEWRIVIVDSADALNRNAANALLKILEEPPPRAVLILISHNPGGLLPTIRSRCRTMRLAPLESPQFARVMAHAAPETTPEQLRVFSLLSGGSPGMALGLMHAKADALYHEIVELALGYDTLKAHAFADRMARKGNEKTFETFTRLFMWLVKRVATPFDGQEVFAGEQAALAKLAARKPVHHWLELWDKARQLIADTEHLYLDKKQVVITLLASTGE